MIHEQDFVDEDLEELAEDLWILAEGGTDLVADLPRRGRDDEGTRTLLERFAGLGLARLAEGRIALTPSGLQMAERQVRRHRLAELLFSTVLEVKDDQAVERTACVMEHVLSAAVTESVCSFLGHPKLCPHGKPIPAGPCCRTFSRAIEPLVQPLSQLDVGAAGRIVYIVPKDPDRLVRLSGLGIVPGATIRLRQRKPATILSVGETTLAVDPVIAAEIYVKKSSA